MCCHFDFGLVEVKIDIIILPLESLQGSDGFLECSGIISSILVLKIDYLIVCHVGRVFKDVRVDLGDVRIIGYVKDVRSEVVQILESLVSLLPGFDSCLDC